MTKWICYTIIMAFSLYWLSNLLLWYPWSISATAGIIIMLTVSPLIWGIGIYRLLNLYPGNKLYTAAVIVAVILCVMSVVSDYIFFGIIRNAMEQLYQPTTFYGYAFVCTLPFFEVMFLAKKIKKSKKVICNRDLVTTVTWGIVCLICIVVIIKFNFSL